MFRSEEDNALKEEYACKLWNLHMALDRRICCLDGTSCDFDKCVFVVSNDE